MSDNYTDEIDSDIEEQQEDGNDIKSLRRAANSKKKLEQELNDLRRELAFARAGISLDDPKMRYFVKGYDGEYTPEAVTAAAIEAGFVQQQTANPALAEAASAQERVMAASAGAIYEDASEQVALARLQAAMEEGGMDAMLDVARQYGIPIATEQ